MPHDPAQLSRIARALDEAHSLLSQETDRLAREYGSVTGDETVAGSPKQTLNGITGLSNALANTLQGVVLAAGYSAIGMTKRADHAYSMAQRHPVSFPGAADRMARPLGEATVRALELIRDLGFFDREVTVAIEAALAAPQATYPPADWNTYCAQR
ncbi:hypothetical protein [Streptomyces sp. NPDC005732]|uniref:hypothetical protein n=1 Tax=Streptomyces sp. NPDC005732 TaxID=3157057 RepID=UPI0033DDB1FD